MCDCSVWLPRKGTFVRSVLDPPCLATSSNCGNLLKSYLPSSGRKTRCGQVNCLGYGQNSKNDGATRHDTTRSGARNGQSAAKSYRRLAATRDAVQRLDGDGCLGQCSGCLRYSLPSPERELQDEGPETSPARSLQDVRKPSLDRAFGSQKRYSTSALKVAKCLVI